MQYDSTNYRVPDVPRVGTGAAWLWCGGACAVLVPCIVRRVDASAILVYCGPFHLAPDSWWNHAIYAFLSSAPGPHHNHPLHSPTGITPTLNLKICIDNTTLGIAVPMAIPRHSLCHWR